MQLFFMIGQSLGDTDDYKKYSNNSSVLKIDNSSSHSFVLNDDGIIYIKAFIEPFKIKQKTIFSKKQLPVSDKLVISRENTLSKRWNFDFTNEPIPIAELPHLLISMNYSKFAIAPEIFVKATMSPRSDHSKKIEIKSVIKNNFHLLQTIKKINLKDVDYTEKNLMYVIKRELGIKDNRKWRYSEKNNELIIQTRHELKLNKVKGVELFSDPELMPRIMQFSIDTDGDGRRDCYILFDQAKHSRELINDRSVLYVDLQSAMNNLKIDSEKAMLVESIIFIPTKANEYLKKLPLYELSFQKCENNEADGDISPIIKNNGEIQTFDFDFSEVLEKTSFFDATIEKLILSTNLKGPQFVELETLYFYNSFDEEIPYLLKNTENVIRSWNGTIPSKNSLKNISSFRPIFTQIIKKPKGFYGKKNSVTEFKNFKKNNLLKKWISPNNKIKGKILYNLTGNKGNSIINSSIDLKIHNNSETIISYLSKGTEWLNIPNLFDKKFIGLELNSPIYIDEWPFQLTLFDIQTNTVDDKFEYRESEWWIKDAMLPLTNKGEEILYNDEDGKIILFPKTNMHSEWTFKLPYAEYLFPKELILPGPLPQPCRMTIKNNNSTIQIPYGPYTLQLENFSVKPDNFEIKFEYWGKEPILWLEIPRIKVLWLRQTPMDDFKKIKITIDGKIINYGLSHLPDPKGEWIDIGKVSLSKGEHYIHKKNSEYFNIKSMALESAPNIFKQKNDNKNIKGSSLLISKFGVISIISALAVFCFIIFLLRKKFVVSIGFAVKKIVVLYLKVPQKITTAFWFAFSIGLYAFSIVFNNGKVENNYYTYACLSMVITLAHFASLIKKRIYSIFPNIADCIYRGHGAVYFSWSIITLIIVAFMVAINQKLVAEKFADIFYFLIVAGLISEILEFKSTQVKPK